MQTDRYLVVIEQEGASFGAYSPDLPGCVALGDTLEETVQLMREAVAEHLAAMRRDGDPIPPPTTHLGSPELDLPRTAVGVIELTIEPALAA
ncbi:MAG: type II toxin-antitoxin system HicB family antitoxin [Candidatus Dormibacteria bacterium]